jgi:lysophospholipase L1-like esterase
MLNLKQIISFVKSFNSTSADETRIVLISPPPINAIDRAADLAGRNPPLKLDREFEVTRQYAQAVEQVAREEGLPFVDVWNKIWDAAKHDEAEVRKFLTDGLHLNEAGYAVSYLS